MAKGNYALCVKCYDGRELKIPFKKIIKLDEFTVNFITASDLVEFLINTLDIKLDVSEVERAYISYTTINYNYNQVRGDAVAYNTVSELPIKYMEDNFSFEDLEHVYTKYLIEDYKRILRSNIRHLNIDSIVRYINANGGMTDRDIYLAVKRCFQIKKPYGRFIREIYFELKNNGYKVKINKNRGNVSYRIKEEYNSDDEYSSYLLDTLQHEPDRYDEIMDEIASYDLDDINSKILHKGVGVVDGIVDKNYSLDRVRKMPLLYIDKKDKLNILSYFTDLNIDELYNISVRFSNGSGRKRR